MKSLSDHAGAQPGLGWSRRIGLVRPRPHPIQTTANMHLRGIQTATMKARHTQADRLEGVNAQDPQMIRARSDLRRRHRLMGTRAILVKALGDMPGPGSRARPWRVLELGAGDGSLMLGVARSLAGRWSGTDLTLLDRQPSVSAETAADYAALGWRVHVRVADVFDSALDMAVDLADSPGQGGPAVRWDLVVCNLFLHHLDGPRLRALLRDLAQCCDWFFACEPRRARVGWISHRVVGALRANVLTRNDAALNGRTGFRGHELADLWPTANGEWNLQSYPSGLFSHCFRAERLALQP